MSSSKVLCFNLQCFDSKPGMFYLSICSDMLTTDAKPSQIDAASPLLGRPHVLTSFTVRLRLCDWFWPMECSQNQDKPYEGLTPQTLRVIFCIHSSSLLYVQQKAEKAEMPELYQRRSPRIAKEPPRSTA